MQKIELCCEICQAKFNANYNTPKVLSCGHTVCSKCVERMKEKNLNKCPFDRKVLDFEDDKIAINYYILSLIDNSVEKNLVNLTEDDEEFTLNPKPVINSPGWKNTLDGFIKGNVMYTVETNGFIYCTDLKTGEWWFMYHNQFFGNFLFQIEENMYLIDQYGSLFQIFNKNYYVQLGKKNIWKNTTHLTVFNNKVFSIEATNKFYETTLKNGKYKEIVITKDNINLNPTANYYFSNNNNDDNCNNMIIKSNNDNFINSKLLKNNVINQIVNNNGVSNNKKATSNLYRINEVNNSHYENKENISVNNINTFNNINNLKRVKFLDKLNGNNNQIINNNNNTNRHNGSNNNNILEKQQITPTTNNHMNSHSWATTTLVNIVGMNSNYNYDGVNQSNSLVNGMNLNNLNYLSSDDYETKIFKNVNMLFSTKKLIFFSNKSGELFSYNDKNKEIILFKTNFYKNIESYSSNSTHVYFFEKNSKIIYRMDIAYSEKDKEKEYFDEPCIHNYKKVKKKKNKIINSHSEINQFTENIDSENHINCKNILNEKNLENFTNINNSSKINNKIISKYKNHNDNDNLNNKNIKNIKTYSENIIPKKVCNSNCNSKCTSKSKKENSVNSSDSKNKINPNVNEEINLNFENLDISKEIKKINEKTKEKGKNKKDLSTTIKKDGINISSNSEINRVSNIYNNYDPYELVDSDIIKSDDEGNELYIEISNSNFLNCEPFFNLETINKELTPIKIISSNNKIVIIDKIGEIYTIEINSKENKCFQCLFMLRNCHLSNSSIIGDGDLLLLDPIRLSLNKLNILAGTEVIVLHSSKFLYTIKNIFSANSRIYFIDVSGNLYYFNEVDKKLTQIGNNGICKYILDLAVYKNYLLTIENNTLYRTSLSDGNYIEIKNDFVKNYEFFFADNSNVIFISKDDEIQVLNFGSQSILQNNDKIISNKNINNLNIANLGNEKSMNNNNFNIGSNNSNLINNRSSHTIISNS